MTRIEFDLDDLTTSALKRLVKQLIVAGEGEEQKILAKLQQNSKAEKESNDLADLKEEKNGSPSKIDPMDDDEEEDA